jgi:hypothetical protein
MKNRLLIIASLMMLGIGLFARSKPEFSIVIGPMERIVKVGDPVEVEVKRTNLSHHALCIVGFNRVADFTYDVRRDGVPVAETEQGKKRREQPNMPTNGIAPGGRAATTT